MKRAFTLLELIIVLSIVILLATLSIPLLTINPEDELRSCLADLTHTCQLVQQQALTLGVNQTIVLATHSITYPVGQRSFTQELPPSLCWGFLDQVNGPPAIPTSKIIQAVTFPAENNIAQITFYPNGAISPGTAYIIDRDKRVMGAFACGVYPVSYIRRYLYKSHQWLPLGT